MDKDTTIFLKRDTPPPQKAPPEQLSRECETLFDHLDAFAEGRKRAQLTTWPLQAILLILSPVGGYVPFHIETLLEKKLCIS